MYPLGLTLIPALISLLSERRANSSPISATCARVIGEPLVQLPDWKVAKVSKV
jgi:hypothetical protein